MTMPFTMNTAPTATLFEEQALPWYDHEKAGDYPLATMTLDELVELHHHTLYERQRGYMLGPKLRGEMLTALTENLAAELTKATKKKFVADVRTAEELRGCSSVTEHGKVTLVARVYLMGGNDGWQLQLSAKVRLDDGRVCTLIYAWNPPVALTNQKSGWASRTKNGSLVVVPAMAKAMSGLLKLAKAVAAGGEAELVPLTVKTERDMYGGSLMELKSGVHRILVDLPKLKTR